MTESVVSQQARGRDRGSLALWVAAGVFVVALLLRMPRLSQSLWFDEMTTLLSFVLQPWQKVVAARAGQWVPNNHVLHTILAKIVYTAATGGNPAALPVREGLLRLVAVTAGAAVPIALAWGLRRERALAVVVAALACVHPWLVSYSGEARGYTLVLLLCLIGTNLLPDGRKRWPIGYALVMAAALYTIFIALVMLVAQGVALFLVDRRREVMWAWGRGAFLAVGLGVVLYLPMGGGMAAYYRNPFPETDSYAQFLDELPRFMGAGERLPRRVNPFTGQMDPVFYLPDSRWGAVYWAGPVLVVLVGSVVGLGRKRNATLNIQHSTLNTQGNVGVGEGDVVDIRNHPHPDPLPGYRERGSGARVLLVTLGVATGLSCLAPLVDGAAGHVRFVPWAGAWVCLAMGMLVTCARGVVGRAVSMIVVVAAIGWFGWRDTVMLPIQPIREAIALADRLAPRGADLMTCYLGAREAAALYSVEAPDRAVLAGPDLESWESGEAAAAAATGRRPWVIMLYENRAFRRDREADSLGVWSYLMRNYRLVARVPGEFPVGVYAPRERGDVAKAWNDE